MKLWLQRAAQFVAALSVSLAVGAAAVPSSCRAECCDAMRTGQDTHAKSKHACCPTNRKQPSRVAPAPCNCRLLEANLDGALASTDLGSVPPAPVAAALVVSVHRWMLFGAVSRRPISSRDPPVPRVPTRTTVLLL